jgi:hypothetical protein
MQERIDPISFSPDKLVSDLRSVSTHLGAPFAEDIVRRTVDVFEDEFRGCVVQMKAASKADTGVYYRFFYKGPLDLTRRAQDTGLVPPGDSPLVTLQPEILTKLPGATRAGLDFDAAAGLAKVWTFTGGPVPVDTFLGQIATVPDSVRAHRDFFRTHGMEHVFFTASDFESRTMNVYFGWQDEHRTAEWIRHLLEETGSSPVPDSCVQDILQSQAVSGGIGTTFSWDSPHMLRWCLYSLDIPYEGPNPNQVRLPSLPPRLLEFRKGAATHNDIPQYNVAWSFGQAGYYVKLEKSYARDATWFLTQQMGGNLSHPSPVRA